VAQGGAEGTTSENGLRWGRAHRANAVLDFQARGKSGCGSLALTQASELARRTTRTATAALSGTAATHGHSRPEGARM
jgi:hypothetical protein